MSVTTAGRHMSNYFYCRIRPERLLYDAARDLLAIAKFLVIIISLLHKWTACGESWIKLTVYSQICCCMHYVEKVACWRNECMLIPKTRWSIIDMNDQRFSKTRQLVRERLNNRRMWSEYATVEVWREIRL